MRKEDLTKKEMKYYRRFKLVAQNINVKDESDVDTVIEGMGSFINKLLPYMMIFFGVISIIIAVGVFYLGSTPIFSVIFAVFFITMAVKLLRIYSVMIPKVAQVYITEELSK
jgi:hypothetical protein